MTTLLKTQKSDSVTVAVLGMYESLQAGTKLRGHHETMRAMREVMKQYQEKGLNPCDDILAFNEFVRIEYKNPTESE